ncbi:unnamed protein product, partial [Amoebophrya sp. A25]
LVLGLLIKLNRASKWVPGLSGVCMLFGSLFGVLFSALPTRYRHGWHASDLQFHPDLFFYLLLPPIIFEAGFSLDRRLFRSCLFEILLFAVGGTVITAFLVSKGLFYLRAHPSLNNTLVCDLFGALIAATDPVATIALLNRFERKFPASLRSLIFGEAILNDAVAIVLFDSVATRLLAAQSAARRDTQSDVEMNAVAAYQAHGSRQLQTSVAEIALTSPKHQDQALAEPA